MTNVSMPDCCKVGFSTRNPFERSAELDNTSVPTPFKVEFCFYNPEPQIEEKRIHSILENLGLRINSRREFFRCTPSEILPHFIEGYKFIKVQDDEIRKYYSSNSKKSSVVVNKIN